MELDSAKHCFLLSCPYWSSLSGLLSPVCSCDYSIAHVSNCSKSSVSAVLLSSPPVSITYDETSIKLAIDEPVMDDLSPLHSVLVMLFWFSMGVIRLYSDCKNLSLTEDISNKQGES